MNDRRYAVVAIDVTDHPALDVLGVILADTYGVVLAGADMRPTPPAPVLAFGVEKADIAAKGGDSCTFHVNQGTSVEALFRIHTHCRVLMQLVEREMFARPDCRRVLDDLGGEIAAVLRARTAGPEEPTHE